MQGIISKPFNKVLYSTYHHVAECMVATSCGSMCSGWSNCHLPWPWIHSHDACYSASWLLRAGHHTLCVHQSTWSARLAFWSARTRPSANTKLTSVLGGRKRFWESCCCDMIYYQTEWPSWPPFRRK